MVLILRVLKFAGKANWAAGVVPILKPFLSQVYAAAADAARLAALLGSPPAPLRSSGGARPQAG